VALAFLTNSACDGFFFGGGPSVTLHYAFKAIYQRMIKKIGPHETEEGKATARGYQCETRVQLSIIVSSVEFAEKFVKGYPFYLSCRAIINGSMETSS